MKQYLVLLVLAYTAAFAGKSGYCYQITPYGSHGGQDFWVVRYKTPNSKAWNELHSGIAISEYDMCVLNPMLVESIEDGKKRALEVDRMGIDKWERQQKGIVNRCKDLVRTTNAKKPKPKPATKKSLETVEICPQ